MVNLKEYDSTLVSRCIELYINILLFMYVGAVNSAGIHTDCGPRRPTRILEEITLVYGRDLYTYYIHHPMPCIVNTYLSACYVSTFLKIKINPTAEVTRKTNRVGRNVRGGKKITTNVNNNNNIKIKNARRSQ